MHGLKCSKSIERYTQLFKGLKLIFVLEDKPEVTSKIQKLRWVVEKELLVPMRMFRVFSHH
jgi:hypothetical protein